MIANIATAMASARQIDILIVLVILRVFMTLAERIFSFLKKASLSASYIESKKDVMGGTSVNTLRLASVAALRLCALICASISYSSTSASNLLSKKNKAPTMMIITIHIMMAPAESFE